MARHLISVSKVEKSYKRRITRLDLWWKW